MMQFTDRKQPFTDCMPFFSPYGPYGSYLGLYGPLQCGCIGQPSFCLVQYCRHDTSGETHAVVEWATASSGPVQTPLHSCAEPN